MKASAQQTEGLVDRDIVQSTRGSTLCICDNFSFTHTRGLVDRDIVQSQRGGAMQRELPALLLCNGPVGSRGVGHA